MRLKISGKILSWLLVFAMVVSMMPMMTDTVHAASELSVENVKVASADNKVTFSITYTGSVINPNYKYTVTNRKDVSGTVNKAGDGTYSISGLKYGDHVKIYVEDGNGQSAYFKVLSSTLENGNFEGGTAGWRTTASDGIVEVGEYGKYYAVSVSDNHGNIAELNAEECASMYQEISTKSGQTISWRVDYSARGNGGDDIQKMAVVIGPALAAGESDPYKKTSKDVNDMFRAKAKDISVGETTTVNIDANKTYQVRVVSDTKTGASWTTYSGSYKVPFGQTETIFALVSLNDGGTGNLVGNVNLTMKYAEAQIGTTTYDTLQDALSAANNNNTSDTIEIVEQNVTAVSGAPLKNGDTLKTYDGGTYTTSADAKISVDQNGNVTFNSGTLNVTEGSATIGRGVSITGASDKTIKNPDGDGDNQITVTAGDGKDIVTVLTSGGKVVIGGTEYTTAEDDTQIEVTESVNKLTNGAVELGQDQEITVGNGTLIKSTGNTDANKTITVKAKDPEDGKSTVTVPAGGKVVIGGTEYEANAENTKLVVDGSGSVELTSGSATLNSGEGITVGGVSVTTPEGAKDITVSATMGKTVTVPKEGALTIGRAEITDVNQEIIFTINESGNAEVDLSKGGTVTINGVTYTGSEGNSEGGTVTINPNTGKVIGVNGDINIVIDENRLRLIDDFSYDMVQGTSVTIGKYVYTALSEEVGGVTIKGRGADDKGKAINPAVVLNNADDTVKVALSANKDTETTYTADKANTVFAMAAGDMDTKNIELLDNKDEKLGLSVGADAGNSALKFSDKDSHTVNGVTYQAQTVKGTDGTTDKAVAYTVTYGTAEVETGDKDKDDKPIMETVNRNTVSVESGSKVIATINAKGTINIDSGRIGDKDAMANIPFTATNSSASILIDNADGTSKISGNGSYLTEIKDENSDVTIGYKVTRYSGSTTADSVVNKTEDKTTDTAASTTATVKNTTETAADGTKTVAATVSAETAEKIVENAVSNKSEEIVVKATTAAAVTETAAGTTTRVDLPEQTVKAIAEKTEAAVTIKTEAAEVTLDKESVKAVAEQAGDTGTVNLVVETVKQDENAVQVDLKLATSKGIVSDFRGGNVSVTVKLNAKLAAKDLVCLYVDDGGIYHKDKVNGAKNADGTFTFKTGHFSEYAIMTADEADKVIADQLDTLIKEVSLKVRTTKTSKKSIKAAVSGDISKVTDAGYTVKYRFYRSAKKASGYTGKTEIRDAVKYVNTAGKKGVKYYYKAVAYVYDGDTLAGKTALTQCKYGCRIWSK